MGAEAAAGPAEGEPVAEPLELEAVPSTTGLGRQQIAALPDDIGQVDTELVALESPGPPASVLGSVRGKTAASLLALFGRPSRFASQAIERRRVEQRPTVEPRKRTQVCLRVRSLASVARASELDASRALQYWVSTLLGLQAGSADDETLIRRISGLVAFEERARSETHSRMRPPPPSVISARAPTSVSARVIHRSDRTFRSARTHASAGQASEMGSSVSQRAPSASRGSRSESGERNGTPDLIPTMA